MQPQPINISTNCSRCGGTGEVEDGEESDEMRRYRRDGFSVCRTCEGRGKDMGEFTIIPINLAEADRREKTAKLARLKAKADRREKKELLAKRHSSAEATSDADYEPN